MANAFRLAGCPRSALRDFIAIAELRIVDEREFESASREISVGSVKDLVTVCRRRLRRHLPAIANMRREGQLSEVCSVFLSVLNNIILCVYSGNTETGYTPFLIHRINLDKSIPFIIRTREKGENKVKRK